MMQTQEVLELLGLSVTISDPTIICSFHSLCIHGGPVLGHKGGNSMAGMKTGFDPQTLSEI